MEEAVKDLPGVTIYRLFWIRNVGFSRIFNFNRLVDLETHDELDEDELYTIWPALGNLATTRNSITRLKLWS